MSPGLVYLQAAPDSGFGLQWIPMVAIFFIFYFLLIRPQQKRQRDQEGLLKAIEKGDSVVTSGGLHGKVTGLTDDVLTLDIGAVKSDRMRVKVARIRIESVVKANKGEES
jgi:preprotein translocase subunit YajC